MEPMVIAGPRNLAADIFGYLDDREDLGDDVVRVMLDCTQFIPNTYEYVHFYGSKCHGREDEDAGSTKLRVLLYAEIFFPSGTSQKHSAMCSGSQ